MIFLMNFQSITPLPSVENSCPIFTPLETCTIFFLFPVFRTFTVMYLGMSLFHLFCWVLSLLFIYFILKDFIY